MGLAHTSEKLHEPLVDNGLPSILTEVITKASATEDVLLLDVDSKTSELYFAVSIAADISWPGKLLIDLFSSFQRFTHQTW